MDRELQVIQQFFVLPELKEYISTNSFIFFGYSNINEIENICSLENCNSECINTINELINFWNMFKNVIDASQNFQDVVDNFPIVPDVDYSLVNSVAECIINKNMEYVKEKLNNDKCNLVKEYYQYCKFLTDDFANSKIEYPYFLIDIFNVLSQYECVYYINNPNTRNTMIKFYNLLNKKNYTNDGKLTIDFTGYKYMSNNIDPLEQLKSQCCLNDPPATTIPPYTPSPGSSIECNVPTSDCIIL